MCISIFLKIANHTYHILYFKILAHDRMKAKQILNCWLRLKNESPDLVSTANDVLLLSESV